VDSDLITIKMRVLGVARKIRRKKNQDRFLREAEAIKALISAPHRGRRPSLESIRNRLLGKIPPKGRSVFKFHAGTTLEKKLDLRAWIDERKEPELYQGFGKIVIFTDNPDFPSAELVKTYRGLWQVEEDFRFLKDRLLIPVTPIFHRNDLPIKVHIFLCVLSLFFYRYMI